MLRLLLTLILVTQTSFARSESAPSVDQFIEIALGQEYAEGNTHLRRWEAPVRVELRASAALPPAVTGLIDELLALLNDATDHPIERVSEAGNVRLYFVSQRDAKTTWRKIAAGEFPVDALCAAQIKTSSSGVITAGIILIPADRAAQQGRLLSCVVEELTQITGLVNDSDRVFPSIFNDRSTNQMLTPMDWLMLRALYRPELQAGMSEAQVRQVVDQLLKELMQSGELAKATQKIRATQLFELLNVN